VAVLDTFGVRRVLSSPAVRCLLTVRQFACSVGTEPEILGGLAEEGDAGPFDEARRVILAAAETASVVVCTHRPVLPGLCDGLGVAGLVTADDNGGLAPGEFLVIHHRGATPVATERHRT
jgi:8-oxo-dGTP diphosphatase